MAPVAAPPPHFPQQPTATQFLLLIQPQTCLWTMAPHQHRIQLNTAAWRNCWTRHSSQRRYQSLAQLTQALQTRLWPPKPQDFLSLVDSASPELSVAAGKSTSKSQEVLHRGCHNPLCLQLPAGESWALPTDQLSPDTRMAKRTICQALMQRGGGSSRTPGCRTQLIACFCGTLSLHRGGTAAWTPTRAKWRGL